MTALCLYYSLKLHQMPLTYEELENAYNNMGHNLKKHLFVRDNLLYKKLILEGIKMRKGAIIQKSSGQFVSRFINQVMKHPEMKKRMRRKKCPFSKMEMINLLKKRTTKIINNFQSKYSLGINPAIFACACIYRAERLLSKKHNYKPLLTQVMIAEKTSIAAHTIRDHIKRYLRPLYLEKDPSII